MLPHTHPVLACWSRGAACGARHDGGCPGGPPGDPLPPLWRPVCGVCLRAGRESLGFCLGFCTEEGHIVRHAVLGGYGLRRPPGGRGPPPARPPSLGRPRGRGRWASDGGARWTGSGRARGGREGCRGVVSVRGQPWGRGGSERLSRLHGQRPALGQGQLPGPPCRLRRAPEPRWTPSSDDVAERAGRAPRRQRLAGTVLTGPRLQEDGRPPAWLHGPQTHPHGAGGQRGPPCRGDGGRLWRGAGSPAQGPPPTEEEEPEPEQEEAAPPETPATVIPSAPVVQERRDILERGSGAHARSSSRWGSPLGPPVESYLVLVRLPSGPSAPLGPAASPRTVEARGRDGSAWRLLVTWLFLTNHQTMCQVCSPCMPWRQ